ncbi:MFS transporter [Actinacidiphila sp. ITFR-21]|uniref:MFS transporter n=1 Tax=Actinacidiphila sp. ITFR-21 TaxID=3075199 RepID=UPI00288A49EC|nr:MFS transporter [Streptomyces sp. ITFR-21]WNI18195.1 MFS transporter [Streptomyces sp. ITFR-21]
MLALAQFVVVLDVTIVNVALPDIQQDLGFSTDGLQWVISAYTLFFGGFLLLGGRAADLLGSRRVFVAGLALFGATSLAAGLVLLAAFVAVEARAAAPLVPLRLLRSRALSTAGGALALNGASFLSMFFLTAVFLQQVRGGSALRAGLEFLPMGGAAILTAVATTPLITRFGTRPVQTAGALLDIAGLLLLARTGADGSYAAHLLPGLVLFGAGIIAVGVPAQIAAVVDVAPREAGAASGVVTAFNQIGGALGLAVVTTLSTSRTTEAVAAGQSPLDALVDGFHRGLLVAAAFTAANLVVTLVSPRLAPAPEQIAEAAAAA